MNYDEWLDGLKTGDEICFHLTHPEDKIQTATIEIITISRKMKINGDFYTDGFCHSAWHRDYNRIYPNLKEESKC